MDGQVRSSNPADLQSLQHLSAKAFRTSGSLKSFGDAMMFCKYWQLTNRALLPESYVLEQGDRIAAHVGLWPVKTSDLAGAHVIDWFADPDCRGVGTALREAVTHHYDFVYSLGSINPAVTKQLLRHGYQRAGEAVTFSRPLRPVCQILHHSRRNWKLLPRLLRNSWWALHPRRPELMNLALVATQAVGPRKDFQEFLATVPGGSLLAFDIHRGTQRIGHLSLLILGLQARVVHIDLDTRVPALFAQAMYLAQQAALDQSGACEIILRTSAPAAIEGAKRAGFRRMGSETILYRGRRLPDGSLPLDFEFGDNDQLILTGTSGTDFLS